MARKAKATTTKTAGISSSDGAAAISVAVPTSGDTAQPLLTPEIEEAIDALVEDLAPLVFHQELRRRLRVRLATLTRDSAWVEKQVKPYKPLIGAAVAAHALAEATA